MENELNEEEVEANRGVEVCGSAYDPGCYIVFVDDSALVRSYPEKGMAEIDACVIRTALLNREMNLLVD